MQALDHLTLLGVSSSGDGLPGLALGRGAKAVECLVDLGVVRPGLEVVEPAADVGIGREIAMDKLACRGDGGAEIVGDR
jgi:hypothetical protein